MDRTRKIILYIGPDENYSNNIEIFYHERMRQPQTRVIKLNEPIDDIIPYFLDNLPNLVFIDFSLTETISNHFHEDLLLIKGHEIFRPVLFVGLYRSKEQLKSFSSLISCGFIYHYVKGTEDVISFLDSYYICFDQTTPFPKYARARDINLNHHVSGFSSFVGINENEVIVETDYEFEDDFWRGSLDLYQEFQSKSFEVIKKYDYSGHYNHVWTYRLKIPFRGPWDDESDEFINKDTHETWMDFNKNDFFPQRPSVYLIDQNVLGLESAKKLKNSIPEIHLIYKSGLDTEECEQFEVTKPQIIIFGLTKDEDEKTDYGPVSQVISYIRTTSSLRPILVIFSSSSTSEALGKAYNYNAIISIPAPYDHNLTQNMIDTFFKKRPPKNESSWMALSHNDLKRIAWTKVEIFITALTEHEITFFADPNIPYYSLIRFNVPITFYATIIPPLSYLEPHRRGEHYMAIINGVSDEDRRILRTFVNYIIKTPLIEFIGPKDLLERARMEQRQKVLHNHNEEPSVTEEEKIEDLNHKLQERHSVVRKVKKNKRSKL